MTTKLLSKVQTQTLIRDLRTAGYPVLNKGNGHYRLAFKSGEVLFEALIGTRGYLVRYDSELITGLVTQ